jgi:DNA-binding transcriptional LysR family regulator
MHESIMLEEMRAFVLLAEEGSIQRVAERIPLTQPAVTRQIQRLESAIGTELLDRRLKPSGLTPAGVEVLSRCRQILSAYTDMKAVGSRIEPEGMLRVGITNGLVDDRLARIVSGMQTKFPKVTLKLITGWSDPLADQLRRGMLDVAFVLSGSAGMAHAENLGREPIAVVGACDLVRDRRFRPATIADQPWILNPEPCDARRCLTTALAPHDRRLNIAAEVQDVRLQLALVREGVGFSLMPHRLLASGSLPGIDVVEVDDFDLLLGVQVQRSPYLHTLELVVDALAAAVGTLIRDEAGQLVVR